MKIGCNYSPELMAHLELDSEFVDAIKLAMEDRYSKQFQAVNGSKLILLHFIPRVFSDDYLNPKMIAYYKNMLRECNIEHVGIHFIQADNSDMFLGLGQDELKKFLVDRLRMIKEQLGIHLLIENMPYYGFKKGFEVMTEPEFIREVCEIADVGLLLDAAHARISAWHLGMTDEEYLNKLPLDRVHEVHLSGPRLRNNRFIDEHEILQEKDYVFLSQILEVVHPEYVTLEYGGVGEPMIGKSNSERIFEQVTEIKRILSGLTEGLSKLPY